MLSAIEQLETQARPKRAPLHVGLVRTYADFVALREQWDSVYDCDTDAQFFLSWSFMSNWLQVTSGHTPNAGGWFILVVRASAEPGADCLAILPLHFRVGQINGQTVSRLVMAGRKYADYTGFLCRPEAQAMAIPALAEVVKRLAWHRWELEFLRCSDVRLQLLLGCFPPGGFSIMNQQTINPGEHTDKAVCPYLELPASWDEYLAQLSHNSRQKLRRMLRAVERAPDLEITHATEDTIKADIAILLDLWESLWQDKKGENLKSILHLSATMLYKNFLAGSVDLALMRHEGRCVGALALWIDERKKVAYSALAGRDEAFDNPSPGRVLQAYSIRRAIDAGFRTYDLGRGNEPFKYWFGAADRRIKSIVINRFG